MHIVRQLGKPCYTRCPNQIKKKTLSQCHHVRQLPVSAICLCWQCCCWCCFCISFDRRIFSLNRRVVDRRGQLTLAHTQSVMGNLFMIHQDGVSTHCYRKSVHRPSLCSSRSAAAATTKSIVSFSQERCRTKVEKKMALYIAQLLLSLIGCAKLVPPSAHLLNWCKCQLACTVSSSSSLYRSFTHSIQPFILSFSNFGPFIHFPFLNIAK